MPASLAEEEESIGIFLRLEAERTRIQRASAVDLILIDRSVHTLLAHCHALEQLTGERYSALAERILRRSTIPLWPDLVIYLDLPEGAVHLRNHGKFSADSIFIDPAFNAGIRSYFGGLARAGAPKVIWIDSTLGAETVRQLVGAEISSLPIS